MLKPYTGIGSRKAPADILAVMTALAAQMAGAYVLRSGAADGADAAFEAGALKAGGAREIYLPWKGFNGHSSELYHASEQAFVLAQSVHPAWDRLEQGPKKLHSRNTYQVLGQALNAPSELVICWTPDGCESARTRNRNTGGTATAIVLAERHGIPVYNLKNPQSCKALWTRLCAQGIEVPELQALTVPDAPVQAALF